MVMRVTQSLGGAFAFAVVKGAASGPQQTFSVSATVANVSPNAIARLKMVADLFIGEELVRSVEIAAWDVGIGLTEDRFLSVSALASDPAGDVRIRARIEDRLTGVVLVGPQTSQVLGLVEAVTNITGTFTFS